MNGATHDIEKAETKFNSKCFSVRIPSISSERIPVFVDSYVDTSVSWNSNNIRMMVSRALFQ